MAVTGVLTSGQWGYPIQGLGSYGGAEEKKSSFMRFTSQQLASGSVGLGPGDIGREVRVRVNHHGRTLACTDDPPATEPQPHRTPHPPHRDVFFTRPGTHHAAPRSVLPLPEARQPAAAGDPACGIGGRRRDGAVGGRLLEPALQVPRVSAQPCPIPPL